MRISARSAILGIIDHKPDPFWGHYHISKIMLKTLLEIYQKEIENSGIRVGTFCPDATDSDLRKIAFPGEDKTELQTASQTGQQVADAFCALYESQ